MCSVMRICLTPSRRSWLKPPSILSQNSVPLRIVSCKGSFVKKCRVLDVWEDATSGRSPFIYKGRKSVGCGEDTLTFYKGFALLGEFLFGRPKRNQKGARGTAPRSTVPVLQVAAALTPSVAARHLPLTGGVGPGPPFTGAQLGNRSDNRKGAGGMSIDFVSVSAAAPFSEPIRWYFYR